MAFGEYRLQFLHISDLHAKGPHEREPWRRRRVLGDAWRRNLETLLAEEGVIHFVFFTGDAAHSGKPEEYEEVTNFFDALCEELAIGFERLFVIPGNHDIDRGIQRDVWESMRMRLAATTRPPWRFPLDEWHQRSPTAGLRGFLENRDSRTSSRHTAAWVRDTLKRPELVPDGLGARATVQLPAGNFRFTSSASIRPGSAETMPTLASCC